MDEEQPPAAHTTIYEEESQNNQSGKTSEHATAPAIARTDSSSASSDGNPSQSTTTIHAPVPTRPRLPSRKSSGTIIVPRDSEEASRPMETRLDPGDVRAMSPRRTSEDLEQLGRQTRAEKYIGDLMTTSKITSTGGGRGKK
ncbi:MAG: hypothetical protein STHCBS139747_000068 [Sporothrix thermara]